MPRRARKGIKMGPLLEVQASETSSVDEAGPGDIVAVAKMEDLHTGSSLGDLAMPPIKFPTPMVGLAVLAQEPRRRNQAVRGARTRSLRKIPRSAWIATRRPRNWS